tara:strand:- start:240 stop:1142 length:903 start_codon:yes stop_codon:yes gene_type:complete
MYDPLFITNDLFNLQPKISVSDSKTKYKFSDVTIGSVHYEEGPVGCTFIDFKNGARVFQDIRGGYTGNVTMNSINNDFLVDGICLAGGSLAGLESITGSASEKMKEIDYFNLPVVNGAIIKSNKIMTPGNMVYADKELGRFAVRNRNSGFIYNGQVGAGNTAINGQGCAFKEENGIKYLVIVINNALGDIYDDKNVCVKQTFSRLKKEFQIKNNTTLTVLIINVDLEHNRLEQMAKQVQTSMGKNIRPFNTIQDGDILYACSTRNKKMKLNIKEFITLCSEMEKITKKAVINSVTNYKFD